MIGISNLQNRGMILVAVPLLLQLVFIVIASVLLTRLNAEIDRELHSQDLVRRCFSINRESVASLVADNLMRRAAGTSPRPQDNSGTAQIERVWQRLRDFCKELQANPKQAQNANSLLKSAHLLKEVLLLSAHPEKFTSDLEKLTIQGRLLALAPRTAKRFAAVIDTEEKEGKAYAANAQRSVDDLKNAALITVIASFAASIVLGFFYASSIRRPLEHLSKNGMLLSSRKELLPVLQSGDEFANLDRLLHTVSDSVHVALLREQAVIENAGDMICALDEDCKWQSVNESGEALLGRSRQSLIGTKLIELSFPEQAGLIRESLNSAMSSGVPQTFELPLRITDY